MLSPKKIADISPQKLWPKFSHNRPSRIDLEVYCLLDHVHNKIIACINDALTMSRLKHSSKCSLQVSYQKGIAEKMLYRSVLCSFYGFKSHDIIKRLFTENT